MQQCYSEVEKIKLILCGVHYSHDMFGMYNMFMVFKHVETVVDSRKLKYMPLHSASIFLGLF